MTLAVGIAIIVAIVAIVAGPRSDAVAGIAVASVAILSPPSLLGESAPLAAVPVAFALLFLARARKDHTRVNAPWVWVVAPLLGLWWSAIVRGLYFDPTLMLNAVQTAITAVAAAHLLQSRPVLIIFIRTLLATIWYQVVVGGFGIVAGRAAIVDLDLVSRPGWTYRLEGPLTYSVGSGSLFGTDLNRLTGWFAEPGIFAAFAASVGLLATINRNSFNIPAQAPIVSALLLSQSLGGLAAYLAGIATWLLMRPASTAARATTSRVWGAALGLASLMTLAFGDGISLAAKQTTNSSSVEDRLQGVSILQLIESMASAPLGIGRLTYPLREINLLQSAISNGPIVLIAWMMFFLGVGWGARMRLRALPVLAGLLLTVMFAQPAYLNCWILLAGAAMASAVVLFHDPANSTVRPHRTEFQDGKR